ncbi:importin-alpha export receptor [Tilletia horrida]|nr:importin-alpha export receptor [Tilletia horrida]
MEANQHNIDALAAVFERSLDPAGRVEAEAALAQASAQPGFPQCLLALIQSAAPASSSSAPSPAPAVRLAAAISLKNLCKTAWTPETAAAQESENVVPVHESDKAAVRSQLLPLLYHLASSTGPAASTPGLGGVRSQLSEAVALVASHDFPSVWPELVTSLAEQLKTSQDFSVLTTVLETAHSIFGRWRSAFRSNELYTEINLVLEQFAQPYLEFLQRTDASLSDPATPADAAKQLAAAMRLLLVLFHDLSAQDLPPAFEDNMASLSSLFIKYLSFTRPELAGEPDEAITPEQGEEDETQPGPLELMRTEICEIAELYSHRYLDAFEALPQFVQAVWEMLGSCGPLRKYDQLVAKAITFLSTVVKMNNQRSMFEAKETLDQFISRIILPNIALRPQDEFLFEEEPIDYIRLDMESNIDTDTRRRAASAFTRALMEQFESTITGVISTYINQYLTSYASDPAANWRSKDTAICLLTSIASRSETTTQGVSNTNALVDVVQFFSDHVFVDLQADSGSVAPILQADAIKYLHTFRNQLNKEQLLSVMPLFVKHLESPHYVVASYAALTIERVLVLKDKAANTMLFTADDVKPFAEAILLAAFRTIRSGSSPEKVAENDYMMKCAMRLIFTLRSSIAAFYAPILENLTGILVEIAKNPSNPKFSHYCFESIAALIRYAADGNAENLAAIEARLFPPITAILQGDVTEFVPYVFQLLAQMLELRAATGAGAVPESYQVLLPPLLTPALWESKGNVPALVRLLRAFIAQGSAGIVANNQLQSLLGIYQRLIMSKVNDLFGFELMTSLCEHIPVASLQPFLKPVLTMMLTRLQTSKTEKFSNAFIVFFASFCAVPQEGFPDHAVSGFESVQPGLVPGLLQGVILPEMQKIAERQRKIVAVGLTRLLTNSTIMLSEPHVKAWTPTLEGLLKLFLLPQDRSSNADDDISAIDWDDASGPGFQASFARLSASEAGPGAKRMGGAAEGLATKWAGEDARVYMSHELGAAAKRDPRVRSLAQAANGELLGPFVQYMASQGDSL